MATNPKLTETTEEELTLLSVEVPTKVATLVVKT